MLSYLAPLWPRHSRAVGRGQSQYCADDVRRLLATPGPELERGHQALLDLVAVPSAWVDQLSKRQARELGRLASRLPTIVYLHSRGASLEEIRSHVGGWSTWALERALDTACACIAARLNRSPRSTVSLK